MTNKEETMNWDTVEIISAKYNMTIKEVIETVKEFLTDLDEDDYIEFIDNLIESLESSNNKRSVEMLSLLTQCLKDNHELTFIARNLTGFVLDYFDDYDYLA